jgi:hypothetical protein
MRLGDCTRSPRLAKAVVREAVPVRPTTVVDGVEFEVVWYPHRDALPLLSEDYPSINGAPLDTLDLSRVLRQTFGGSKWGQE